MADPLNQIQSKIKQLEKKVKDQQSELKKWKKDYYNAKNKIDTLENKVDNPSEVKLLEEENATLRSELNSAKRKSRKLNKIKSLLDE